MLRYLLSHKWTWQCIFVEWLFNIVFDMHTWSSSFEVVFTWTWQVWYELLGFVPWIWWSNLWADRQQAFVILIYARIWPSTRPSSHFQGHRKVLFETSSESLELQVFTTFFIEFALYSRSNAIFSEPNLDVLDQWFEVEQMDSRITSWWTMRINKHVIFSDWWILRSKCQHDQRSFTCWFSFRN